MRRSRHKNHGVPDSHHSQSHASYPESRLDLEGVPAVVLLSGGMDSTVLLHHVVRHLNQDPVHTLSFDYGQRHGQELECAHWQANAVGVEEHRVIRVGFLGELLKGGTVLIGGSREVPNLADLPREQLDQPPTYVPNRNMILLNMAVAYAEARRISHVYYGAHVSDAYGYWDCTADFVQRLNHALALNRRQAVTVHAPFIAMDKASILAIGLRLGVDFRHTWSCYRGHEQACGTCPTCVERLSAFRVVGVADPLPYGEM